MKKIVALATSCAGVWIYRAILTKTCRHCRVVIPPGQRFILDDHRRPLCLPCYSLYVCGLCEEDTP